MKKCKDCEGFKKDKMVSECACCGQKYKLTPIKNDKEKTTRNR